MKREIRPLIAFIHSEPESFMLHTLKIYLHLFGPFTTNKSIEMCNVYAIWVVLCMRKRKPIGGPKKIRVLCLLVLGSVDTFN